MCNFFQGEKPPVLQQALSSTIISKLCSEVSYRLDLDDIPGGNVCMHLFVFYITT